MKNPDYQLKSDSVSYNLDSEIARFYTRSYIWNKDDEFLTALKGSYDRKADLYTFTDQSYILTKTPTCCADCCPKRMARSRSNSMIRMCCSA